MITAASLGSIFSMKNSHFLQNPKKECSFVQSEVRAVN